MMVLVCSLSVSQGIAQASIESAPLPATTATIPDIEPEAGKIHIAIWIIDIYTFDFETGSYTFDMFISFFWNDPNISSINWHMMNGAPNYSGAFHLVSNGSTDEGVSWEFHRATADLNTPLEAEDYPFSIIELPIAIEILSQGYEISLTWLESECGIGPGYKNLGWADPEFELKILKQNYPYNVVVERAEMVVIQERQAASSRATMIPPIIFCVVSAFSFLLRMDELGGISMRIGLNTSMLITTVLYNISEASNLPPSSGLTLWNTFMISVITFIALNTLVTVLGYLEFSRQNRLEREKKINRLGFLVSLAVPIAIFLLLTYLT